MELVSVIIPTFNSAKFIGAAINSIVEQNYPSTEIIVVDDGSADDTVAIARRKLEETGIAHQLIKLPANGGPSAARNVGFERREGRGSSSWTAMTFSCLASLNGNSRRPPRLLPGTWRLFTRLTDGDSLRTARSNGQDR